MDYADIIKGALTGESEDYLALVLCVMKARALMHCLEGEAISAVRSARASGALLSIQEWRTMDAFDLQSNGRKVTFRFNRDDSTVYVDYEGFPVHVVPELERRATVAPGESTTVIRENAQACMAIVVSRLFQKRA